MDEQRWLPPTGFAETIWYTDPDAARGLGSMTAWLASDERHLEAEAETTR